MAEPGNVPLFDSQRIGRVLLLALAVAAFPAVWAWNRVRGERVRW